MLALKCIKELMDGFVMQEIGQRGNVRVGRDGVKYQVVGFGK
jgi:hypothetical protein